MEARESAEEKRNWSEKYLKEEQQGGNWGKIRETGSKVWQLGPVGN